MLDQILSYLKNDFTRQSVRGVFSIVNGVLMLPFTALPGQYIRIHGSVLNDGVYVFPLPPTLKDETFRGTVAALAVPNDLIALSSEIKTYVLAHPENPYSSESFGGYSYSKASDKNGATIAWTEEFRVKLNRWRKIG